MDFRRRNILGLAELSPEEIGHILDVADSLQEISQREIKKVPTLRGKSVILLFVEPSTRTRVSFEMAAKRLSADTFAVSPSTSSMTKGESLIDTARNLQALKPDVIVIRHWASGAPHLISRYVEASVLNAGDGAHEHPSQALLDLLTVRQKKGRLKGLKLSIIGDLSHSRVARSNIIGFSRLGAEVTVFGPATLIPPRIEALGCRRAGRLEEALEGADVVMALRVQRERLGEAVLPSEREYATCFGLNRARLKLAQPDVLLMHPGPVNWGVELSPELAEAVESVILEQVTNGLAVRMALLLLVLAGSKGVIR